MAKYVLLSSKIYLSSHSSPKAKGKLLHSKDTHCFHYILPFVIRNEQLYPDVLYFVNGEIRKQRSEYQVRIPTAFDSLFPPVIKLSTRS